MTLEKKGKGGSFSSFIIVILRHSKTSHHIRYTYIKMTGENRGIRKYLRMLWFGRKMAKLLEELILEKDEKS
jgi:hypothetical protein